MSDLRDKLHSEIDEFEELAGQAAAAVESVKRQVAEVTNETDIFDSILTELSARLANEIAPITTAAARKGIEMARKRGAA
jgi:regulator of replication initiation timing